MSSQQPSTYGGQTSRPMWVVSSGLLVGDILLLSPPGHFLVATHCRPLLTTYMLSLAAARHQALSQLSDAARYSENTAVLLYAM